MRFALALALIATPALADETEQSIFEMDCMEVIGPVVYGPETYGAGVIAGIALGYAVANGHAADSAKDTGRKVAAACRENMGMTFREALSVLDQG